MNLVKMVQMCNAHLGSGNYELAKALAKRIDEILKNPADKIAEAANCCCSLRDRTEVGLTSCEGCRWENLSNIALIKGKLGIA
jgi:hypothetical protein